MDRFKAMYIFNRIVDSGSFSAAAKSLDMPRSSITASVQQLEKHLNASLLIRTTRKLSITPEGWEFYNRSRRILSELDEMESLFTDIAHKLQGRLRVDLPANIGHPLLIPRLAEFHDCYPDLELVVGLNDRRVDLVAEGVDCVIRIGELDDSSLITRSIGLGHRAICASPDYLSRYGTPENLEDLPNFRAVNYMSRRTVGVFPWEFVIDGRITPINLSGDISVDDSHAYISCGMQGMGLIAPMRYLVRSHLETGDLVEILPDQIIRPVPVSILYPQNRHLSLKLRVFIDWATGIVGEALGERQ